MTTSAPVDVLPGLGEPGEQPGHPRDPRDPAPAKYQRMSVRHSP